MTRIIPIVAALTALVACGNDKGHAPHPTDAARALALDPLEDDQDATKPDMPELEVGLAERNSDCGGYVQVSLDPGLSESTLLVYGPRGEELFVLNGTNGDFDVSGADIVQEGASGEDWNSAVLFAPVCPELATLHARTIDRTGTMPDRVVSIELPQDVEGDLEMTLDLVRDLDCGQAFCDQVEIYPGFYVNNTQDFF